MLPRRLAGPGVTPHTPASRTIRAIGLERLRPLLGANAFMIMILICFIAPWLAMFLRGHVIQGILCIILHLTLIGWIPATIWALIVTRREGAR